MPYEDYMHDGWHRIHQWNKMVFADAKRKAEEQFDSLLDERERKRRKKMPPMQSGDPSLWHK
jgi:hypothetical protein